MHRFLARGTRRIRVAKTMQDTVFSSGFDTANNFDTDLLIESPPLPPGHFGFGKHS